MHRGIVAAQALVRTYLARRRVRRLRIAAARHADEERLQRQRKESEARRHELERREQERKERERMELEAAIRKAEAQAAAEQRIAMQAEQARAEAMARQLQIQADVAGKRQELAQLRQSVEEERLGRQLAEVEAERFRHAQAAKEVELARMREDAENIASAKRLLEEEVAVLQRQRLESHARHGRSLAETQQLLAEKVNEAGHVAMVITKQEAEMTQLLDLTQRLQDERDRHKAELEQLQEAMQQQQQVSQRQLQLGQQVQAELEANGTLALKRLTLLQQAIRQALAIQAPTAPEQDLQPRRACGPGEMDHMLLQTELQLKHLGLEFTGYEQGLGELAAALTGTEGQTEEEVDLALAQEQQRKSRAQHHEALMMRLSHMGDTLRAARLSSQQQTTELNNVKMLLDNVQRDCQAKEGEADRQRLERRESRHNHAQEQEKTFSIVFQLSEAKGKAEAELLAAQAHLAEARERHEQEKKSLQAELDQYRARASSEIDRLTTTLKHASATAQTQEAENRALAELIAASRRERREFEEEVRSLKAEVGHVRTRVETSAQNEKEARDKSKLTEKRRRQEALEELRARVRWSGILTWVHR